MKTNLTLLLSLILVSQVKGGQFDMRGADGDASLMYGAVRVTAIYRPDSNPKPVQFRSHVNYLGDAGVISSTVPGGMCKGANPLRRSFNFDTRKSARSSRTLAGQLNRVPRVDSTFSHDASAGCVHSKPEHSQTRKGVAATASEGTARKLVSVNDRTKRYIEFKGDNRKDGRGVGVNTAPHNFSRHSLPKREQYSPEYSVRKSGGGSFSRRANLESELLGSRNICQSAGVNFLDKLAVIESGGNPQAIGDKGRSLGAYQLSEAAWCDVNGERKAKGLKLYPWKYAHHPYISKIYAREYLQILQNDLRAALRRPPTEAELLSAYQSGITGFKRRGFSLNKGKQ